MVMQVILQTHDEKIAMYMKLTKRELAVMLVNANNAIDLFQDQARVRPPEFTPWIGPNTAV